MFNEKFLEVIAKEGVVSIVSGSGNEPHIVNTWNSYLNVAKDNRILIPAAGMKSVQADIDSNNKVQMTLGSKEVKGLFAMGAGFYIRGTAKFVESGQEYEMMKAKFPFLSRVLEITVTEIKQTI